MKVLCKKTYFGTADSVNNILTHKNFYDKDKYYDCVKNGKTYNVTNNFSHILTFYISFEEYFYTPQQLRKLKLKKINESTM